MNNHAMARPSTEHERAVAASFLLLHGNPPKAIRYHRGNFAFRSAAAHEYKRQLQNFVSDHARQSCLTTIGVFSPTLAEQARNRCLRYIMGVE